MSRKRFSIDLSSNINDRIEVSTDLLRTSQKEKISSLNKVSVGGIIFNVMYFHILSIKNISLFMLNHRVFIIFKLFSFFLSHCCSVLSLENEATSVIERWKDC